MHDFSHLDRVDPYDDDDAPPMKVYVHLRVAGDSLVLDGTSLRYRAAGGARAEAAQVEPIRKHLQAHVDNMHNSDVAQLLCVEIRPKSEFVLVPIRVPARIFAAVHGRQA